MVGVIAKLQTNLAHTTACTSTSSMMIVIIIIGNECTKRLMCANGYLRGRKDGTYYGWCGVAVVGVGLDCTSLIVIGVVEVGVG